MQKSKLIRKRLLAILFVIILFCGFLKNGSYMTLGKIFEYLSQTQNKSENELLSVDGIENSYTEEIWMKNNLITINGEMARKLKMQGLYSDLGMYVTDDNYIVSVYPYTSTDYEYEQMISFRDFLKSNGVNLLYVNEPTKYLDDNTVGKQFGVETYSNRNMDVFLDRIREAGIDAIDLRENIKSEKINVKDMFYRTDHHWTTTSGLWATRIIAQGLNDKCGYNIDTSIYNKEKFNYKEWKKCWLGEQGRKVGVSYVGLDDYTEVTPKYPTRYTFFDKDGTTYDGTFKSFIYEWMYNTEYNIYDVASWYCSYNQFNCVNQNVAHGKVLIIGDSFNNVVHPFLSLGVHQVDSIVLRDYDDSFSLRDYIKENSYDTVIVAYAQFMVGQHDNPKSANYNLFRLDH